MFTFINQTNLNSCNLSHVKYQGTGYLYIGVTHCHRQKEIEAGNFFLRLFGSLVLLREKPMGSMLDKPNTDFVDAATGEAHGQKWVSRFGNLNE